MLRAVVFVGERDSETYLDNLINYCQSKHYEVVGVVHSLTGAEQMHAAGEADVLVVGSWTQLPIRLEITTDETPVKPPSQRRESPNPPEWRRERPHRLQ